MPVRHRVLWIYAAMLAMTQFQWMRFAPMAAQVGADFGLGPAQVGALSLAVSALALPLALPAGGLIDRISVRACLRLTAVVMLLAACLRVGHSHFAGLLAGQLLFGLVQPLTLSVLVKLMQAWFPAGERGGVAARCSMVIFLGIGAAFVLLPLTPPGGVARSLQFDVALFALIALLTFTQVPADPQPVGPVAGAGAGRTLFAHSRVLLRTPSFVAVLAMIFLTNGCFSALTTWLEPLLARQGVDARSAGYLVVLMLVGGMLGSVTLHRLTPAGATAGSILGAAALGAGVGTVCLLGSGSAPWRALAGLVVGAAWLSPLPLLLQRLGDIAGPARSGTATAIFWLVGNLGATLMTAALGGLAGRADVSWAVLLLCLAMLVQIGVALSRPMRTDPAVPMPDDPAHFIPNCQRRKA